MVRLGRCDRVTPIRPTAGILVAIILLSILLPPMQPDTLDINLVKFSGGGVEPWLDGGEDWPQLSRFGSRNGSAPSHSPNGGPGSGSVANVTELMTIEEPAVNWVHFASTDYGAQGLASVVGDFSGNIIAPTEASERCGEGHLFTVVVSERDSGGSTHSFLSIIEGDTSRKAWEVDLGSTDSVKAAPVLLDVDGDGTLEILVAYDAQGTFNSELWSPELVCGEAGWSSGGSHLTEKLWSYTDPDLGITSPSPYIWANHQIGSQILLGDADMDGDAEAVFSLVNEADSQVVILTLPLAAGGTPTPLWQVSLDHGEIPSDPAWVKIDDTNSAVLLTTIDPDDGNVWVWRLDGGNGAPTWGGVSLNNLDGNTDSPHIRLPGPIIAELDGTPGAEMVVTIPTDIDGGSSGDGAEYIGMEVNDASELWSLRATNGFADAPPDVFDTDADGVDDRLCWVTWYRIDTDRKGVSGCHDLTGVLGPEIEFSHTMDSSSGNPNDEIAVSPPFHLDLDGQGAPETLVAFGRSLWAWDGDLGTQAGIGSGWVDELPLKHRAWAAPALADIDGDGALDVVIGDTVVSRAAPDIRPFVDGRGVQFTPSQPDPGEEFTATVYVENVGTISSGEVVDVALYYDGVEVHRELLGPMDPVAPSGSGNFATFSVQLVASLGTHTARVVVDQYENISQSRFDNDVQLVELTIVEPYDLSIGISAEPPRVSPGSSLDIHIPTTSTGRLSGVWTMSLDDSTMPANWSVEDVTAGGSTSVLIEGEQAWTAIIRVSAPDDALGSDAGHITILMTLDDDTNVTVSAQLPIEALRTRGLSIRGPTGTTDSSGYGLPGGEAAAWLLVENLGNAVETVTDQAWQPTTWGNNLTLHDSDGEVPLITLQPGEQLELHAKLPVPIGTALTDQVSTPLTICIGSGEDEVCRTIQLTFVANGVTTQPDSIRSPPAVGLSWVMDGVFPPSSGTLSWDLSTSGMLVNGWSWQVGGSDCSLSNTILTCSGMAESSFSATMTLDQPADAPPQVHSFTVNANNLTGYLLIFSVQVLQVHRAKIEVVSPTESPLILNVTEPSFIVLRLENPGNGPDEYILNATVLDNENFSGDSGVIFDLPSSNYSIGAASLRQVPVQVTLPAETAAREGMLIQFSLRSAGNNSVYDSVVVEVEARQDHRWDVVVRDEGVVYHSGETLFKESGGDSTIELVVTNIGNFNDTLEATSSFTLSHAGNDTLDEWVVGNGSSGLVELGQNSTISIPLTIPQLSWNGTVASVELTLSAGGMQYQVFTINLEVSYQPQWLVSTVGGDLDVDSGGGNITLQITQMGNAPTSPYLFAQIDGSGWNISLPSALPSLDPGHSTTFDVFVLPPESAVSGPTVELTVLAKNGDGSGSGQTILPVRVRPDHAISIDVPDEWEGWLVSDSGGMVRLAVGNSGNAPNQVTIELVGLPDGWGPMEAEMNLAWGESRGIPIDLIPDSSWDHSEFSIEVRVTDLSGMTSVVNVNIAYSDVSWASSPVMWGVVGDDKVINLHGGGINSVTSEGSPLAERNGGGWTLPDPSGEGSITVDSTSGTTTLLYTATMQPVISRPVTCSLASNHTAQPVASCQIGSGDSRYAWTIILRDDIGTTVTQREGVTPANEGEQVNLTSTAWNPSVGIHELTILVFTSEGHLVASESRQYIIRASGWNLGIAIEESDSGDINLLISRENHQIMDGAECRVELTRDEWAKLIEFDISATLAPKLSVVRPSGDSTSPLQATLACAAPWDIDDDMSDNNASLVLSPFSGTLPVQSDTAYAVGAALLVIAVLWLLGVIRPANIDESAEPTSHRTTKQSMKKRKETVRATKSGVVGKAEVVVEKTTSSDIHLEDELGQASAGQSETTTTEEVSIQVQESLIEIEGEEQAEEVGADEEELDEFELRLRRLKNRHR